MIIFSASIISNLIDLLSTFSGVLPWLHMFINWWNRSLVIKNSCALENSMGLARRHSFFLFIPPFCRGPPTINSIHEMLHGSLLHRMTFSHDFYNSPTSPTRCTPRPPCCPNILVKNKCAGPWLNDKKLLPIFILKANLLRGVLLVYTQCSFGFTGVKFWTAPEGTVCESYVLYVPISGAEINDLFSFVWSFTKYSDYTNSDTFPLFSQGGRLSATMRRTAELRRLKIPMKATPV